MQRNAIIATIKSISVLNHPPDLNKQTDNCLRYETRRFFFRGKPSIFFFSPPGRQSFDTLSEITIWVVGLVSDFKEIASLLNKQKKNTQIHLSHTSNEFRLGEYLQLGGAVL
jgi:hypothetical protein